jgi:RING finger protein 113A
LVQGSKRRRDFTSDDADADGAGGLDDLDYAATDTLTFKGDQYATRGNDHDTDVYGAITHTSEKKRLRLNEDGDLLDGAQAVDDGQYRGLNNYLPTINKTREVLDKKMKSGPIRATASVRTITLVDYQPDVCKDYKETGFCGYGDSCKFMHDRGDYLAGWQLDKLDPDGGAQAVPEEDDEEEVPFACLICRKEFTEPVVTKCGHYFCMS